jgi:hypothetical protein
MFPQINSVNTGNFSGPKNHEIVVAKGNVIELLRPDDMGKVVSVCCSPVFATVRSLLPFRLAGTQHTSIQHLLYSKFCLYLIAQVPIEII